MFTMRFIRFTCSLCMTCGLFFALVLGKSAEAKIWLTQEQEDNLLLAHSIGSPNDRGYTLMAIVLQESSAHNHIVADSHLPKRSYGLTGLRIVSMRWMASHVPAVRDAIRGMSDAVIAYRLVHDNHWHLDMALHYFKLLERLTGSWRHAVIAWNWGITRVLKNRVTGGAMPQDYYRRIVRHLRAMERQFPNSQIT